MDWVIAIPSYNRVDTLKEKTLHILKEYNIPASKIYVFVANAEQKKIYEEGLEPGSVGHIIIGIKGLAEVRNFIFDYFPKGKPLVCMDDDIREIIEYDDSIKRHESRLKNLVKIIDRGFSECKKAHARLWGVYPSANGFFMKPTVTTDFRFIIGSFWGCYNPGKEVRLRLGSEKEDYQRTIQFWELDGAVVRLNFISPKTAYYKEPGGMQEGDRLEKQKKTVKAMLDKWPQYIKMNPSRKSGYPEIRLVPQKTEDAATAASHAPSAAAKKRKTRKIKRSKEHT
jgi:hypothetical protein